MQSERFSALQRFCLDVKQGKGLPIEVTLIVWGSTSYIVNGEALNREIFDRLQSSTAAQPAVLVELCRDYLVEARATVIQLGEALSQHNALQVRDRAHYLKGSSMMLGAREVSSACSTLETMGRTGNLAGAAPVLEDILAALKRVEAELTEIVGPTVLPAEGSAA